MKKVFLISFFSFLSFADLRSFVPLKNRNNPIPTVTGTMVIALRSGIGVYQDNTCTTPATANNDVVGCWKDQSGNGNNVVQATTSLKPLYKTGLKNGYGGIVCDGVDDYLQKAFAWSQPEHYFVAFKWVGDSQSRILDGANNDLMLLYVSLFFYLYPNIFLDIADNNFNIIESVYNGASSYGKLNNVAAVTGNQGGAGAGGLTLCTEASGASPSNSTFLEFIGYSTQLSTADANLIRSYLNAKYLVY